MNRPRIVLDTNILVSAALKPISLPYQIIDSVISGRILWCSSHELLREYEGVLNRTHLALNRSDVQRILDLARAGEVVDPAHRLAISPHEPDNRFLECAEAADADFLVTGNKRHFPARWKRTEVVTARELLDRLGPETE